MEVSGVLGAETALFTPIGDVDITEKVLFPELREVNVQLEKDSFRSEWAGQRMGDNGQLNKTQAAEINEAVIKNILGKVGTGLRSEMWTAAVGSGIGKLPTGGFKTAILASIAAADDESAGHVDGTTTISASNVKGELSKMLSAVAPEILSFDETRLFVAPDVWFAYSQAVASEANMLNSTQAISKTYGGYKMVVVPELAAGEMVIANKSNLHFGTDIYSDYSYVETIDLSHTTGDRVIRYIQKVALDVKVGYTKETAIRSVIA